MIRGSISSELLMCGGGVRRIFLLPLVARCLDMLLLLYMYVCMYMAHVCFHVCCSDCVGSVGKFVVLRSLLKIVFF